MSETELLLAIADDELVLGWRDSEWTGIAPVLEEDVAFSSIAQNEIGHARAIYQLLVSGADGAGAAAPGQDTPGLPTAGDADALAFDRAPAEYRSAQLVELRFVPDWARTIARRVLYEAADELRLAALKTSDDEAVAGLAAKIDREEAYHRMHAEMWHERLRDEPRYNEALDDLWPYLIAMADRDACGHLCARFRREMPSTSLLLGKGRGDHVAEWPALWEEMTEVRRSVPGAAW